MTALPQNIIIIRHALSIGNEMSRNQRAQSSLPNHEFPVSQNGKSQIKTFLQSPIIQLDHFDGLFTSSFVRTKETARLLFPDATFQEHTLLNEKNHGIWQSYTDADIELYFPQEVKRKQKEGLYYHKPIAGESFLDLELRILQFIEFLKTHYAHKNVLVIGHGQWIITLDKMVRKQTVAQFIEDYNDNIPKNLSINRYRPSKDNPEILVKTQVDQCV